MIGPTTNSGADAASGHFRDFFEGLEVRELHYACAVKCNFAALRMHWGKGNQTRSLDDRRRKTSEEGWLIAERPLCGNEERATKYYFSNLPAELSLKELTVAVRARWPIEHSTSPPNGSAASATSIGPPRGDGRRGGRRAFCRA